MKCGRLERKCRHWTHYITVTLADVEDATIAKVHDPSDAAVALSNTPVVAICRHCEGCACTLHKSNSCKDIGEERKLRLTFGVFVCVFGLAAAAAGKCHLVTAIIEEVASGANIDKTGCRLAPLNPDSVQRLSVKMEHIAPRVAHP